MKQNATIIGALLMAAAVGLGAFGAHALKPMLVEKNLLDTYQTAVLYHLVHALGILILGQRNATNLSIWSLNCLFAGILAFSGSLYAYCFTGIRLLNFITPFGGVLFMVGWVLLVLDGIKQKKAG